MPDSHSLLIGFAPEDFQRSILKWYDAERRDLPWRAKPGKKPDPYHVWLSEIMLQQTTVKAVIPYFQSFLAKWPSVEVLGAAQRDEVLAAWAGLGYYSRARNLHACAQELARDGFPNHEDGLRKLPGIGPYTAAAIAAIAFDKRAAAVDGNVERVVSRLFALDTPFPAVKPIIRELALLLTPERRTGDYAQALMDLGATICTPRSPACLTCPTQEFCRAAAQGKADHFPVKAPKVSRPIRRGNAYVVVRTSVGGRHILLRRRPDKGLLGGMMEVPGTAWTMNGALEGPERFAGMPWVQANRVQHTFTHFHLELQVFASEVPERPALANLLGGEWAPLDELNSFALPSVMKKAVAAGLKALKTGDAGT